MSENPRLLKMEGIVIKCPNCRHKGIVVGEATDGRPEYKCNCCSYTWTKGKKGYG